MRRWRHPHSLALGAAAGAVAVSGHPWLYLAVLALAFAAGLATAYALVAARRLVRRIDRALPDRSHACAICNRPIDGKAKYCSETCREIAAENRMRQRIHAERLADYDQGGVPL